MGDEKDKEKDLPIEKIKTEEDIPKDGPKDPKTLPEDQLPSLDD